jgi:Right handed beta helix region
MVGPRQNGRTRRSTLLLAGALALAAATASLAPLSGMAAAAGLAYHVDCQAGNDANGGTSPTSAWRTIGRATQQTYGPGDQVLLKRGCVWSGTAAAPESFVARGSGSADAPVVLADYGTGNLPKIDAQVVEAVKLENVQDWTVRNLDLTQHGQTPQALDPSNEHGKDRDKGTDESMHAVVLVRGLATTTGNQSCGEPCTARNIRLENLKVHDGAWNGVFGAAGFYELDSNRYGYLDNLVVQGVEAWNNHKAGIEVTSTYTKQVTYHATNVAVLDSYLHHNGGDGVMMGPVDHGLIDGNECAYNGQLRNARLGCWAWDSHDVVIQFNESHHNITPLAVDQSNPKARDGGGFDLDLGSEDSVMQYNWSHDNAGEGYLLLTWPIGFGYARGVTHHAQMRYNVSERDGQKLAGGITVFGGVAPAWIYNNTIYYVSARPAGSAMFNGEGAALTTSIFGKSGKPDLRVFNNLFITDGTVNPGLPSYSVWSDGSGTFAFDRNLWWRPQGGVAFRWGGTTCTTFACWQALGFDPNGANADPQVAGPLGAGPTAYQLTAGSPAAGRGAPVAAPRGMGARDYFGDATPQGGSYDAGADELSAALSDTNSNATPVAHATVSPSVRVADIWTTDTSGTPRSVFANNTTVNYKVRVVDDQGQPVPGVTVTSRVYAQDWSWLTPTTLSDVTDSGGVADFSVRAGSSDGIHTIVPIDVVPPTSLYYDSALDSEFRQAFQVQ